MTDDVLAELRELRAEVAKLARPQFQPPPLWSLADISEWLGQCDRTTRDTVKMPRFPQPVPGSSKNLRWFASEVIEWARVERRRK